MNYVTGALRYVAGGETNTKNAIPRLVDRIKTSALPQDRRSAISALTEAAKASPQNQIVVGELALKILYAVLEQDKDYDDNLRAALELLIAVCGTLDPPERNVLRSMLGDAAEGLSDEDRLKIFEDRSAQAAATNVDVFLGLPNAASLLLDLLEKTDFYVKFGTIELLTAMAANSRHTLQMAVLEAPQGVSRICDLLDDSHRHVRSNAVLLLSTLCDESQEICKIVAYGGVLEKLFALIDAVSSDSRTEMEPDDDEDDENLEAAIVVQDVLLVLRNLINGTNTTRTFFRDTGCLPRLVNVVKRCAEDAGMRQESSQAQQSGAIQKGVGMKAAVEKQARKNLVVAMHCISGLVREGDNESRLVKDALSSTDLFNLLAGLAFSTQLIQPNEDIKLPEHLLQVRIGALKTMALLARGHDEYRALFSSSSSLVSAYGETSNAQVAAMRVMSKDQSAAARAAAYAALRESFIVDAGLDLPSSSLLNAMTTSTGSTYSAGEGRSVLRRSTTSASSDLSSSSSAVQVIAESLKGTLVGWPNDADPAGVFYAASLVTWVVDKVQGSRERLLASYVNGYSLLPQVIRVLGKLEREKGPAEVRIGLFSLACIWLYNSPSAVSAFLSSAMHLPMLVEVLNQTGSRGDIAEVHVRGLAAVLIGICLHASEASSEPGSDGGFVSGVGGASAVIPRQTLVDVIRNRIGVTEFTACIDDLRASKAFSAVAAGLKIWEQAEQLVAIEDRSGLLSTRGSLGHEMWYSSGLVAVVDDVYKNVGARALDLVSDQQSLPAAVGNGMPPKVMMNGFAPGSVEERSDSQAALVDSARDEVLNSYKEFIRSQDESLNAARRQIEELSTALRETQMELDAKASEASAAKESDTVRSVNEANSELTAQIKALEALLEEKTADFAALSDAYAALEEEQSNRMVDDSAVNTTTGTEVLELRTQNSRLRESLDAERSKNAELFQHANALENSARVNAAELEAVRYERDQLRVNSDPGTSAALQWRSRAEVAETELASRQALLNSLQQANNGLGLRVQELERIQDETSLSASIMQRKLQAANVELEDVKSARKRELQVARESAQAANTAAEEEIANLRKQLSEALKRPTASSVQETSEAAMRDKERLRTLEGDHQALLLSFEQMKTELIDTKNALTQWQRQGETTETAREREAMENARLTNAVRTLDGELSTLRKAMTEQTQATSTASVRVAELERQTVELEEMRLRSEEESKVMKEELAVRTEQTITLSGQLYEAQDANLRLEEEVQRLQSQVLERNADLESGKQISSTAGGAVSSVSEREGQGSELETLRAELEAAKDALLESQDLANLSEARAREREAEVERNASLERSLEEARTKEKELQEQILEFREKLLSIDEAEYAKRSLTMQVVSLQKSLAEATQGQSSADATSPKPSAEELMKYEEEISQLHVQLRELNMRNEQLNASLESTASKNDVLEKEKSDLAKQVDESEAMLSVLTSQKDDLATQCEELKKELDSRPRPEESSAVIEQLRNDLRLAEDKRAAVSSELSSLIDACRVSEQESLEIRSSNEELQSELAQSKHETKVLREARDDSSLLQGVSEFVNSVVLESVISASSQTSEDAVHALHSEKEAALARVKEGAAVCRSLEAEMAKLKITVQNQEQELSKTSQHVEEASVLRSKLARLEAVSEERDNIKRSLQEANALIKNLEAEKAKLVEVRRDEPTGSVSPVLRRDISDDSNSISSQKRVIDLESALKDAAKTVSATNMELLSAQALLVELSADKTAIRNELRAAQEEIQLLNAKLSVNAPLVSTDPALSEISEQDHAAHDALPDGETTSEPQELVELRVKTANAEAENLRTALMRTISEADSASSLLAHIQEKVGQLQSKLESSRSTLRESKEFESQLQNDIDEMRKKHQAEVASMLQTVDSLKRDIDITKGEGQREAESWREKLGTVEEKARTEETRLQGIIDEKEDKIRGMKNKVLSLEAKLDECNSNLRSVSEKATGLETSNSKYASTVRTLEGTVQSVNKSLADSQHRENSLKASLEQSHEELVKNKNTFVEERRELENRHKAEVVEFEAEIDRASQALEEAERKFRDTEVALKGKLRRLEEELSTTSAELTGTKGALTSTKSDLESMTLAKETLETTMRDTIEQNRVTVASLTTDVTRAKEQIEALTGQKRDLDTQLFEARANLKQTEHSLREEREQKDMLEGENQDFLSTIESLEASSKRLRDDLNHTKNELEATKKDLKRSKGEHKEAMDRAMELKEQLQSTEENVKQLRTIRGRLENEAEKLQEALDAMQAAKEAVEQDNSDLKAWVGDLERQATELQSAAENFEDVEQSLREALEAQRQAAEQNCALSEELRKEKEALALAEANLRGAIRDRTTAESARESSQKRAVDLENRIREIREEHLAKVSSSEDTMRAKAQRCAELETELASAERKLAELASVSDTLFGVRAELGQREEEIKGLKERAQSAETRVEELRVELQRMEGEMAEMRESGTGDAYRALEAEHNELLVCLAELELECTSLKEELGRE